MSAPETCAAMQADPMDPRHGTVNGYNNLGCRCDRCREAWADCCRRRVQQRKAKVMSDPTVRHGRYTTYGNHRCRCDECRAAWLRYWQSHRFPDDDADRVDCAGCGERVLFVWDDDLCGPCHSIAPRVPAPREQDATGASQTAPVASTHEGDTR